MVFPTILHPIQSCEVPIVKIYVSYLIMGALETSVFKKILFTTHSEQAVSLQKVPSVRAMLIPGLH